MTILSDADLDARLDALAPLVAAAAPPDMPVPMSSRRFRGRAITEGKETIDGRTVSGLVPRGEQETWPLTLDHDRTKLAGAVTSWSQDGRDWMYEGVYADNEHGTYAADMADQGMPLYPSVELGDVEGDITYPELEAVDGDENVVPIGGDHEPKLVVTSAQLCGLSLVTTQAQDGTWHQNVTGEPSPSDMPAPALTALPASAVHVAPPLWQPAPLYPPRTWFTEPVDFRDDLDAINVTDDGQFYAFVAPWGQCHIGFPDVCVEAEPSPSGYHYYANGSKKLDDGSLLRGLGRITMGKGHADLNQRWRVAAEHYDDPRCVIADVAVGENDLGIWVAGSLRPNVTEYQLMELRASGQLSGDWRDVERYEALDMVGALVVNVAGFPAPTRRARMEHGRQTALVAAGFGPDGVRATLTASASGATDLPIADRGRAWDAGAAKKRMYAAAGGPDNFDPAKYGRGFFWKASGAKVAGDFSLPFADIVDGTLTAIPKGIFAAAGAMSGARGGVKIPSSDVASVKSKIAGWYGRLRTKFKDPSLKAPWLAAAVVDPSDELAKGIMLLVGQGIAAEARQLRETVGR